MKKVFITQKIPDTGIDMLKERYSVNINKEEQFPTKEEIKKGIKDADALLCLLTDKIDKDIIDSAQKLKVIANYAVGYDNIDIEEATNRGIMVTNTPGVLTQTTADLAWSLLMVTARRIVEGDSFTRAGRFNGWKPKLMLGYDIYGKTLGIVGTGRIGTALALRSQGFNMKILYYDIKRNSTIEEKLGGEKVSLEKLLKQADFISIHTPLTEKTYHLMGEKELSLMKETAILVNTSRGPVIDEEKLANALQKKTIAGAGIDVYEKEPEVNKKLIGLKNVVLTPHIGSASYETRSKMAEIAAHSIIDVLEGRTPKNVVN
jgi:glyoxylate reductase